MKAQFLTAIIAVGLLAAAQRAPAQQYYGMPQAYGAPYYQAAYAAQMQAAYGGQMQAAYAGYMQPAGGCAPGAPAPQVASGASCAENACAGSYCDPEWRFYGDFLYMRARNAEVPYAVIIDGPAVAPDTVPIQVAPYDLVDPDYEPAFRVGFSRAINQYSSMGAQYTRFESDTSDSTSTTAPTLVRSLLVHPTTWVANSDGLAADCNYGINFQLVDAEYRYTFFSDCSSSLVLVGGASYANLEQELASTFGINATTSVLSDIDFNGAGIRLGLEGERRAACTGFMVYGRSSARFLAGEFEATHLQGTVPGDPTQIDTAWKAGRIVTILDLELGLGWSSYNGCINLTCGYLVSGWFNTVRMAEWISAVQANDLRDLGSTLTFDGVTARAEIRF